MKRKELYKTVAVKKYKDMDSVDYLEQVVVIKGDKVERKPVNFDVYLWALFGSKKEELEFECPQVGASIDGCKEIDEDIQKMLDEKYSLTGKTRIKQKPVNTQFYEGVYYIPCNDGAEKSKYQYRKIKEDYEELYFYRIDIDKYLGVDVTQIKDTHIRDVFNLSKAYYAETKFAFETQALYWNAYRSGVGMETLKQLLHGETARR